LGILKHKQFLVLGVILSRPSKVSDTANAHQNSIGFAGILLVKSPAFTLEGCFIPWDFTGFEEHHKPFWI
jgi:hypothetical protein